MSQLPERDQHYPTLISYLSQRDERQREERAQERVSCVGGWGGDIALVMHVGLYLCRERERLVPRGVNIFARSHEA